MRVLISLLLFVISFSSWSNDQEQCGSYIKSNTSESPIYDYLPCLNLAKSGHVGAQYAIAASYEKADKAELAIEYYLKAANKKFPPAMLSLGHTFNEPEPWKAIYWYQRYYATGAEGSGYAAKLIAIILTRLNLEEQAEFWIGECSKTSYAGC